MVSEWKRNKLCPRCDSNKIAYIGHTDTPYFKIGRRLCQDCGLIFDEISKEETEEFIKLRNDFYSSKIKEV